jgi:hypothetical protein
MNVCMIPLQVSVMEEVDRKCRPSVMESSNVATRCGVLGR